MKKALTYISMITVLLFLASCGGSDAGEQSKNQVNDPAGLINSSARNAFINTNFGYGLNVYLHTVKEMDSMHMATQANNLFLSVAEKTDNPKEFRQSGVLVLLSESPSLIMVRFGTRLRYLSGSEKVSAGIGFMNIQALATDRNYGRAVERMSEHLKENIPAVKNPKWYKKSRYNRVSSWVAGHMERLGQPSDGFYGRYILKPVYMLRAWELRTLNAYWVTFVFNMLIFFAVAFATGVVIALLFQNKIPQPLLLIISVLISSFLFVLISIPAVSSAYILALGRMEDYMALESRGIALPGYYTMHTTFLNGASGFGMILLLSFFQVSKGFFNNWDIYFKAQLTPPIQNKIYNELKLTHPSLANQILEHAMNDPYGNAEVKKEYAEQKPYSYALMGLLSRLITGAIVLMVIAIWVFPQALTLAIIIAWLFPFIRNYIIFVHKGIRFNKSMNQKVVPVALFGYTPLIVIGAGLLIFTIMSGITAVSHTLLAFLFSPGILLGGVISYFLFTIPVWLLWTISIGITLFLVVQIVLSWGDAAGKIWLAAIITTASFAAILIVDNPDGMSLGKTMTRLLPGTSVVIQEQNTQLPTGQITIEMLNMRSGPGTSHDIIRTLKQSDTFIILDKSQSWWKISVDDTEGYISGTYAKHLPNP